MRKLILGVVLIQIILFSSCHTKKEEKGKPIAKKPNVVLIMTDDQGWGDLSIHGNKNLNTPNIDALALNGVSFENFYVQPVCSPTRAELLTGRYFTRLGVYETSAGGERMNLGETTIAEVFKHAGYKTAAYGKWHNGMQPPYHPNARGFDDFYGFASGHWGNYFSPMLERNGKIVKGNGFLVDDLTDKGLEFIEKNQENPFFLYLPYNTPHSPMQVPDIYWDKFENKTLQSRYQGEEKEDILFTKAALAMVENVDYNVGRITTLLKKLGLDDDTIIVFLSDNGPNGWRYNGGMKGKKGSTDEGGVRSPFFVQWKNVLKPNTKIATIASALDILPTLTDLADIELIGTKPIDGHNLAPILLKNDVDHGGKYIFNHWNGKTSVRSQEFRLDNHNRLFKITADRSQEIEVTDMHPEIATALSSVKMEWLKETLTNKKDDRPFTLGHPDYVFTQIPARDGIAHGNIERSNQYPNDSFFTNWTSITDSITWDVEVLADGEFEVQLYYTCKPEDIGTQLELSHGHTKLIGTITQSHDPPLLGKENDRTPRIESYIKDFKPLPMGKIHLNKGRSQLTLKALKISGKQVGDIRMVVFKRI
ncbi:arylsulfatase [Flavobacteriaceae bacterium GF1]